MRPRYLLVAGQGAGEGAERLALANLPAGFQSAFSRPGLSAFVNEGCGCRPVEGAGCILGTLMRRGGEMREVASLSPGEAASISAGGGAVLLRRYWGGYVAALTGTDGVRVMRDPSAALPCYFVRGGGFAAFASDAELLVELGLAQIEIDWRSLAAHLYADGVPSSATALFRIYELLPGFVIEPGADCAWRTQSLFWSPWDHVAQMHGAGEEAAAERVRWTVGRCVGLLAERQGRLLVSISGGLDSSIVAASLAAAGAEATCLTLYGEDPESDERPFARLLCKHLRLPLVERPYRVEDIDLAEAPAPHLPRPSDRTHALSYERAHLKVALNIGAEAFVTGNGGDSVFGYSQSAAAIADRYLHEGLSPGLAATVRDICVQTGCGIFEAVANAVRIARGPRSYRCRGRDMFLDREAVAALGGAALAHPWLDAPAGALPGKSAHVASILRVLQCLEPGRGSVLPVLNPLLSQPVVETCLSVPSWNWRTGGLDRSLARRAFAADLPPAIVRRHVKGGPDGFTARILDRFRRQIRERLLDGHLAREKIVDGRAVAHELDHGRGGGEERARILELVAAEAWIERWLARRSGPGASQGPGEPALSLSQCASSSFRSGDADLRPRSQ